MCIHDDMPLLIPIPDCIIEALGNPQRERLKHGDTNISNWLKGEIIIYVHCSHSNKTRTTTI